MGIELRRRARDAGATAIPAQSAGEPRCAREESLRRSAARRHLSRRIEVTSPRARLPNAESVHTHSPSKAERGMTDASGPSVKGMSNPPRDGVVPWAHWRAPKRPAPSSPRRFFRAEHRRGHVEWCTDVSGWDARVDHSFRFSRPARESSDSLRRTCAGVGCTRSLLGRTTLPGEVWAAPKCMATNAVRHCRRWGEGPLGAAQIGEEKR